MTKATEYPAAKSASYAAFTGASGGADALCTHLFHVSRSYLKSSSSSTCRLEITVSSMSKTASSVHPGAGRWPASHFTAASPAACTAAEYASAPPPRAYSSSSPAQSDGGDHVGPPCGSRHLAENPARVPPVDALTAAATTSKYRGGNFCQARARSRELLLHGV